MARRDNNLLGATEEERKEEMNCARCDRLVIGLTTLVGEYSVYLCPKHRNDWFKFIEGHEVYREYSAMLIRIRVAVSSGSLVDAGSWDEAASDTRRELHDLAEEWVNS